MRRVEGTETQYNSDGMKFEVTSDWVEGSGWGGARLSLLIPKEKMVARAIKKVLTPSEGRSTVSVWQVDEVLNFHVNNQNGWLELEDKQNEQCLSYALVDRSLVLHVLFRLRQMRKRRDQLNHFCDDFGQFKKIKMQIAEYIKENHSAPEDFIEV